MIVKLLNGEILSIASDDVDIVKHTIARQLDADVDDVQIVFDEEQEQEEIAFVMIVRKPRVIEMDLADEKVIHEICVQISNPKFINTSLIEYFLSHILSIPKRPTHTFAANPHPLIVEYLITNVLNNVENSIPLRLHMYLVRNPSGDIVNHPRFVESILSSPNKITLINDLTVNTNPRAREILVDLLAQFPGAVMWSKLCGIPDDGVVSHLLSISDSSAYLERLVNTYEFLRNPSRVATLFTTEHIHLVSGPNRFFFYVRCLESSDPDVVRHAIDSKCVNNPVVHLLDNPCEVAVDLIILSLEMKTLKPTRDQARRLVTNPADRLVEYLLHCKHITELPEFLCNPHPLATPHQVEWIRRHFKHTDWVRILPVLWYIRNPDTIWHLLQEEKVRDNTEYFISLLSRVDDVRVC